jgi:hypothetical protein
MMELRKAKKQNINSYKNAAMINIGLPNTVLMGINKQQCDDFSDSY